MKKTIYIIALFSLVSCNKKQETKLDENSVTEISIETGKQLFETSNCAACHQPNEKVVGPSLQNIAQIYISKKGNLVQFLKEEADPIVDPEQYPSMKINLQITKSMTDEELKSLEMYILNQK